METKPVNVKLTNVTQEDEFHERAIKPNLCNFPFKLIQRISQEDFYCLLCFSHFGKRKNGLKHARIFHANRENEAGEPEVEKAEETSMNCPSCHCQVHELMEHWLANHSHVKRTGCLLCARQFFTSHGFMKHGRVCPGSPPQEMPTSNKMYDMCSRLTVDIYLGVKTPKINNDFVDFLTRGEVGMLSRVFASATYVDMAVISSVNLEAGDEWLSLFVKILQEYLATLQDLRVEVVADLANPTQVAISANVFIDRGESIDVLWLDVFSASNTGFVTMGPAKWVSRSLNPNCILVNYPIQNARGCAFWQIMATRDIHRGEKLSVPDYFAHRLAKDTDSDID